MTKKYLTRISSYKDAEERYVELSKAGQQIEKRMLRYPDGKIHIIKKKGKVQFYLRTDPKDKSGEYMSKKEDKRIRQYLQKKYDEDVLHLINQEKSILKKSLLRSKITSEKIQRLYSSQPQEVKDMIIPIDVSDDDYATQWLSVPYENKPIDKEKYSFKSNRGEIVRSKSEANIANALYEFGVPYKYECPLIISNGQIIHPDFTVLNKRTRKVVYWEHRGMMDDREYAKHTVRRIKQMEKEGIFLGDNLIITEETNASPLGTDEIEMVIKHYFSEYR